MDAVRLARQFRALRVNASLRQDDLARRVGVTRTAISNIERGLIEPTTVRLLLGMAAALGATIDIRLRWRGEQLDRLLDEAHAQLVDVCVRRLRRLGWEVAVEVSFSIWGERGSIDIFAHYPATGTVLVVEVKSVVPDSQATISVLDRKARLAPQLAADRGWDCRLIARLLVVGSSTTTRRRISELAATYDVAFPVRGTAVREWLRRPSGAMSGLLFVPYETARGVKARPASRQRVCRGRSARARSDSDPNAIDDGV
jgi:transcriptional regulator with XRE-family HTH domain